MRNSEKDEKLIFSLYFLVFTSTKIAIIVNVIKEIANGKSDL